jgi:transposase-like protein
MSWKPLFQEASMPWREVSAMDERREFVRLAMQEGVNRRELCRRFGISPEVGYKWPARWQAGDRELVYFEQFDDPENAIKREKRLKKWNRA